MLTKNIGGCERTARLFVGAVLAGLAYFKLEGTWQIVASVVAGVMLLTGISRYCPLYPASGCNSDKCGCGTGKSSCKCETKGE